MRKPTARMMQVLKWIAEGLGTHYACRGMSEHGGRQSILKALAVRELITWRHEITDKGRELLNAGK